jgi:hypothetical protein
MEPQFYRPTGRKELIMPEERTEVELAAEAETAALAEKRKA